MRKTTRCALDTQRMKGPVASKRQEMSKRDIAERRAQVAELYARRITQRDMAKMLKVSEPTISRDVKSLLKEWRKESTKKVDDVKAREMADLDAMERDVAMAMVVGKNRPSLKPQELARLAEARLRIKERRAKLLGLDAPAKLEASAPDGEPLFANDPEAIRGYFAGLIDSVAARFDKAREAGLRD